jgi:magnesium-transporting ATPase (P-type)
MATETGATDTGTIETGAIETGAIETGATGDDPPPSRRQRAFDEPHGWGLVGRYTLLIVVAVIVLFPIYTTVIAALKPGDKVLENPLLPDAFTLDVLREAWTNGRLGRYILNSTVVAVVVTIAQLTTAVLAAYAFAFLRFPGRNMLFLLFLATLLVPLEATLVVNFDTVDSLGWLNTYQGLAVPFLATALASSCSDRHSSRCRPTSATRRVSTASATSGSSATSPCRSSVRRSVRSRCSASSARGTSTFGRI